MEESEKERGKQNDALGSLRLAVEDPTMQLWLQVLRSMGASESMAALCSAG